MLWSKNVPLAINTTPVLRHSVHSMTFAMSNNCVYLPFRKNCCKGGEKETSKQHEYVFGFRMCEEFYDVCTPRRNDTIVRFMCITQWHDAPCAFRLREINVSVPYLFIYERRNREIVFCGRLYQRIFRISTTTFSYAGSVSPALYMWAASQRALHLKVADVDLDAGVLAYIRCKRRQRTAGRNFGLNAYIHEILPQ